MGCGFVIEGRGPLLSVLRREPEHPGHHLLSLLVGIFFIRLGARVGVASSVSFRRFDKAIPSVEGPSSHWSGLALLINVVVAAMGFLMSGCLLVGSACALWSVQAARPAIVLGLRRRQRVRHRTDFDRRYAYLQNKQIVRPHPVTRRAPRQGVR